ncbi:hypothetical protein [Providencia sp. PROV266]|uniref:hypothetical protein n=1 Tax=Providencia sp. PROV266 TaxID=2949954 RepID=UPI00234ABFC8|nr:hypothetical protein [Providencia sp. PROV266]
MAVYLPIFSIGGVIISKIVDSGSFLIVFSAISMNSFINVLSIVSYFRNPFAIFIVSLRRTVRRIPNAPYGM